MGLGPLISVIMPVYNNEKFINEAINSVLHQSYANFELIIWDDGSTDNTVKKLEEITDVRVSYYHSRDNKGAAYARNQLFKLAQGEYIALMDSDDLCHPDRFNIQLNYLKSHEGIDIVGTDFSCFGDDSSVSEIEETMPTESNEVLWSAFFHLQICNASIMFRSKVLDFVGGYDVQFMTSAEDLDFVYRALLRFKMCNISQKLYFVRKHNQSASFQFREKQIKNTDFLRRRFTKSFFSSQISDATILFLTNFHRGVVPIKKEAYKKVFGQILILCEEFVKKQKLSTREVHFQKSYIFKYLWFLASDCRHYKLSHSFILFLKLLLFSPKLTMQNFFSYYGTRTGFHYFTGI
jgi:glycosyltransferase involved in cell wall biosynthesis